MRPKLSRRILLCMHNFPPISGPRSFRWLNLVKSLHERGWSIDVLTVRPSPNDSYYDESLLKELPSEISVYRSYPGLYYSLQHIRKRPFRGFPKATIEWLPFGLIRGFRILKQRQYTLIISSALPFVGHLVAYFLKKKAGIPWVADYGDPLAFNPSTSRLKKAVGKHIEERILRAVDGIVVPFPEMKKSFIEFYPFLESKPFAAVRNGVNKRIITILPTHFQNKLVISFIGSFYKGNNEPIEFFNALSLLKSRIPSKDLEIIIAGNTQDEFVEAARQRKLQNIVIFKGQIPYSEAISLLKGTGVILYIGGRQNDYHFAYKIFECAAAGRPVLALRQSDMDLGADFIENNEIGMVIPNEKTKIVKALIHLHDLWKNNQLESTYQRMNPEQFFWEKRGEELEFFIKDVLYNK